ncbi:MAG: type II toxin-antitoxin system RelE/ParE family toxin [Goleter apudmare HA4340-LM2]|jgi:toxin ParE1/3/4|nr:type II toxin-antitoxin system RelE/ParE family toxin [Goleter apudmare HA4340-LM2]
MNRYRISQQAEQDLEDIWTYLAQQNQLAADKQIAQILNRFPMLAQFPDMGKKQDDLMDELRSSPVKPYVVFYKKINDGIEIFRVFHQSRDVEREFL